MPPKEKKKKDPDSPKKDGKKKKDKDKDKDKKDKGPVMPKTPTEREVEKMSREQLIRLLEEEKQRTRTAGQEALSLNARKSQLLRRDKDRRKTIHLHKQTDKVLNLDIKRTQLELDALEEAHHNTLKARRNMFCQEVCELQGQMDAAEAQWTVEARDMRDEDTQQLNSFLIVEEEAQLRVAAARNRAAVAKGGANRVQLQLVRANREEQEQEQELNRLKRELRERGDAIGERHFSTGTGAALFEDPVDDFRKASTFRPQDTVVGRFDDAWSASPSPIPVGLPGDKGSPRKEKRKDRRQLSMLQRLHAAIFKGGSKGMPSDVVQVTVHKDPDGYVGLHFLGTKVMKVYDGGPAARAGLEAGMEMVQVENTPVHSEEEAAAALRRAAVRFTILLRPA
eukprot:Hpha_TRINITY_DN16170_c0_g12::TRINITY_DN16170_c0_g12_i1::g.8761::m.8761